MVSKVSISVVLNFIFKQVTQNDLELYDLLLLPNNILFNST